MQSCVSAAWTDPQLPKSDARSDQFQSGRLWPRRLLRPLPGLPMSRQRRDSCDRPARFSARAGRHVCAPAAIRPSASIHRSPDFARGRGVDQPTRDRRTGVAPHRPEPIQWMELVVCAGRGALLPPRQASSLGRGSHLQPWFPGCNR